MVDSVHAAADGAWDARGLTRKQLGDLGEAIAGRYLESRGYQIVERSWRCREGEADLVAIDPGTGCVVLAEVKTRRAARSDDPWPEDAVDRAKRRRYRRIAACYAMERFPVRCIRFDVIAIVVRGPSDAEIRHYVDVVDWER